VHGALRIGHGGVKDARRIRGIQLVSGEHWIEAHAVEIMGLLGVT
jgi:hypothetical protein